MSNRLPPLRALGCFEVSARLGSFTLAADELCLTPSAVSHQISLLEKHLGFLLFKRAGRRMILTESGREYFDLIRRPLKDISTARSLLKLGSGWDTLCVKVPSDLAATWIVPRIAEFVEAQSHLRLKIITGEDVVRFDEDEPDVEIRYGHGKWPTFEAIHLVDDYLVPVCSPGLMHEHPISSVQDVVSRRLINTGSRSINWKDWAERYAVDGIERAVSISIDRSSLVRNAAIAGAGVALESRLCVDHALRAGMLVMPVPDAAYNEGSYYYTYSKATGEPAKSLAFKEWVIRQLSEYEDDRKTWPAASLAASCR